MITFDPTLLSNFYQARLNLGASSGGGSASVSLAKKAPTAPWSSLSKAPKPDELAKSALSGRKFINEQAAQLDVKGASEDYRKLFALHQGLATLEQLARRIDAEDVSSVDRKRIEAAFSRGMQEVSAYVDASRLETLRLAHGEAVDRARTAVGVPKTRATYVTAPLARGASTDEVEAFLGDVRFSMRISSSGRPDSTVNFDLAEMGQLTRSMDAVVKYMNEKLLAAGVFTRMAVERISGEDKTTTLNGRTVTLARAVDSFALKVQGDSSEEITFSASDYAPAVYLAQTSGNPDPDKKASTDDAVLSRELIKFETGNVGDAVRRPNDANWVDGRVFSAGLPENVSSIGAMTTGADGSVYMVASLKGAVEDQTIKGQGDAALLKYDSAGKLIFTRTLGAVQDGAGLGLAVAADGRIAISGSVTGALIRGDQGSDPTLSDSFVTVFDALGQEIWTQRQGASSEDEATGVAFAPDGGLMVLGRVKGSFNGQVSAGGWDNFLRRYDSEGRLMATAQFGSLGDDRPAGLVVSGQSVIVASAEVGIARLRSFDASGPGLSLDQTRDLGALGGGSLAGLALDGGDLMLGGSASGALLPGAVTRVNAGGLDVFGLRVSATLNDTSRDAIAYFGGAGEDRATSIAVADGKVWVAGATKDAIAGLSARGTVDGFIAALDVGAGSVGYSQRFTSTDGYVSPGGLAVNTAGASVLDRLGLPSGQLEYADSQRITAATAARAGDTFQIRARSGGSPVTVTIEDKDTLETLAAKVRKAGGFSIRVDVISDGDVRRLQIKPANERSTVQVLAGVGGRNALEALGLQEGYVRATRRTEDGKTVPADGGTPIYGLKLDRDLRIASKADVKAAIDELTFAMSAIRGAYRNMQSGGDPQPTAGRSGGEVPAYLRNQVANYQAGLDRLLGGG